MFYKCIDFGLKTKISIILYPIGSGIPRANGLTPQQEYTGPDEDLQRKRCRGQVLHVARLWGVFGIMKYT